jgi:hypothetical protein
VIRTLLLLTALFGLLIAAAPAANAATRTAIIRDCEDDSKLAGTYTAKELRDARSNIPSDQDAYSDCRDVLGAAIAASAARGRAPTGGSGTVAGNGLEGGSGTGGVASGSGSGSGSVPLDAQPPVPPLDLAPGAAPISVTEPEKKVLRDARARATEADVRGQTTVNGVRAVAGQAATATIPTSLVVVLVLLGVTVLLAAAPYVRRRVVRRRTA